MTDTADERAEDAPDPGDASDDRPAPDGSTATRDRLVRAGHVLGLLLLILVVLPFVVYAVPGAVGAEHSYVVLSGSMEPTLSPGDVIFVDDVPTSDIEKGDVISFRRGGEARTTTHRVIEVVERDGGVAFRTKGDNNEDPDQTLVEPAQVEGEVMSVNGVLLAIPYIGYVIRFAATQTGFALLAIGPLALLVLSEIWNIVASTRGSSTGTEGDGDGATDGTDAGGATAGADGEATSPEPATDEVYGSEGFTIRLRELQLGLAILGAFLAYSIVVAYVTTEPWTIGVAAAVAASFALLGGLYFFGGAGDASDGTGEDPGEGGDEHATGTATVADGEGDGEGDAGDATDGRDAPGTAPGGTPATSDGGSPAADAAESADAQSADAAGDVRTASDGGDEPTGGPDG